MKVQTQLLQQVDRFDEFFDLYKMEHRWLSQNNRSKLWNLEVLDAKDSLDFTRLHLQELASLHLLNSDWP